MTGVQTCALPILGPTVLSGLVGNVAIPRATAATQTYWVTEASAVTESEATFDQVTLSPKQIGARSQYSRLALQQTTPDIEQIVRNDLARVMALGIDKAAISGTGSSGQPLGILNQSGIGSVAMGTNGAAFTDSASGSTSGLDQLIALEGKLDVANALNGNLYYLTNAKVVQALKKLKTAYGEYLWTAMDGVTTNGTPGGVNGYTVMRSNQVPSTLTKGTGTNLSALIFGDFSQLVIEYLLRGKSARARQATEELVQDSFSELSAILRTGAREGAFRHVDPIFLYEAMLGACETFAASQRHLQMLLGGKPFNGDLVDAYARFLCDVVLNGITSAEVKPRRRGSGKAIAAAMVERRR